MASIFTQIIRGEIACHKVYEDEKCFAFMELFPLNPGHVLVVPKEEVDYFFDLDEPSYVHLTLTAKKIAQAVKKAAPCQKVAMIVYGLQVRHAHVHLIPVHGTSGELNFSNQKKAPEAELEAMAAKIRLHVPY